MPDNLIHIPYPFVRKTYDVGDNPEFIGDIRVLSEGIMSGLAMMANLGPDDFAIVSGMEWVVDTIPYYNPGYFYLKGVFYRMPVKFTMGQYLVEDVQVALTHGFNDGSVKTIYQNFSAIAQPADPGNGCPLFNGNMNDYRIGLDWLADNVRLFITTYNSLGGAAFKNVGNTAGTVMAGDDPRAPYTADQLDARYAQNTNVILKVRPDGTPAYDPAQPEDPANKKYVDSVSMRRLASGKANLGDADTGPGTSHTISLGVTLQDTNYLVFFTVQSNSANPNLDIFYQVTLRNPTVNSFDLFFREAQNGAQNVMVHWMAVSAI